ncbi:MAG: GNAT family N-acetyltransferase [Microgenomates group bacterium]
MTAAFFQAMDATWPAAKSWRSGPWTLREGLGGGKRVSAATVHGDWTTLDIPLAEAAMRDLGQSALFMVQPQDTVLDEHLAQLNYKVVDPVLAYSAPIKSLTETNAVPLTAFSHWPPMAITREVWADAGIGPARLAVMDRVLGHKTALLARAPGGDRVCGAGFVAMHDRVAVLHALEVNPAFRRQGSAQNMIRAAAHWAQDLGADSFALAVTTANAQARRLYEGLGMSVIGGYHYRELIA